MGNCLVTKLKGTVDNDNLEYLGKIKFDVVNGALFGFNQEAAANIEAYGDITLTPGVQGSTAIGSMSTPHTPIYAFTASGTRGYILVPKYNLTAIYVQCGAQCENLFSKLGYSPIEMVFWANFDNDPFMLQKMYGTDIVKYAPGMKYLLVRGSYYGSVIDIDDLTQLSGLVATDITDVTVHGKYSDLGKLPNLVETIRCTSSVATVSSLEEFVHNKRALGQTTGSMTTTHVNAYNAVTFNGQVIPASPSIGTQILTWTADTITFNDVTINA